jgi:para-nitrobenzyl esterase
MVVVIAQYRLGPIGWLYHPALQDGDPLTDSGNFGTLDNIQALKWIKKNIRAFGGNPRKVTITGESAGAHNVMNLVISPLAKGLFHRAMSESGGMTTDTVEEGLAQAEATIAALLAADGLTEVPGGDVNAYLRSKTAAEIFESYFASYFTLPTYDAYQDGAVLPGSVVSTIRSGNYNKVPIIVGANEYETKAFMPLYGDLIKYVGLFGGGPWGGVPSSAYTWKNLLFGVMLKEDENGCPLNLTLDEVFPSPTDKLLYQITGYYGSLNWRAKFVDERARALKEQQWPVYAYLFKWGGNSNIGSGPSPFDFIYGAGHATEISFFFGSDESLWGFGYNPENDTAGRQALSDAMMQYLANFARTGNPNGEGLPLWRRWSNKEGRAKVMQFDADYQKALLTMSNEEVTFDGVSAGLLGAASMLPQEVQDLPWYFQWSQPE